MSVVSCASLVHRHGNTESAVFLSEQRKWYGGMEHKKAILVVLKHIGFIFKVTWKQPGSRNRQ